MRIVFLGTPGFALPTLNMLHRTFGLAAVVCQPDREKDRKGRLVEGAVRRRANELSLPVYQFEKVSRDGAAALKGLRPDLMVTCAYGQLLSQEVLDIPPLGVLNVHGSLLPKYRGAAPIQRALMAGEAETGVTVMKTDKGMDSGAIVSAVRVPVPDGMYVDGLYEALSEAGARLLAETLPGYCSGELVPVPQDAAAATLAPPLKRADYLLDFSLGAETLRNQIRGAGEGHCLFRGEPFKVYRAELCPAAGKGGEVLRADKTGLCVACGAGALVFTWVQAAGKKRMAAADFINGSRIRTGERFENGR
ncbi:MAG: methionyl-tRNA formyltransferase [Clostridiales bacterium]|jgi:methionyl-tRNA formyltransferase|nr:methionyl-tRNA formyltransferase [Clostridiales bacterium]